MSLSASDRESPRFATRSGTQRARYWLGHDGLEQDGEADDDRRARAAATAAVNVAVDRAF
jgi:hypothetical protein